MNVDVSTGTASASTSLEELGPRAAEAEAFLKAMANRHRLMILCELHKGERCVTDLQQAIGLAQSALSQHLAKLREEDIVTTRRQSQTIFYTLADHTAARLIALLYEAYCKPGCMNPADAAALNARPKGEG
jgi:DNA-binding transcriptional ArsR family regulator